MYAYVIVYLTNIVIVRGENYTFGQYKVTLPAGMIHIPFNVPITDDNMVEVNEKFDLIIDESSLPSTVHIGSINQATVIILDDDGK